MVIHLLGGIGLFLIGMHLLTDGLQHAGGTSMKKIMSTMVSNRFRGIVTGAALTTAVQSSSAITVLTIGLTSAGILKLKSTIAIVLGANIGSTTTAWLVSLAGLKFSLASLALPMVTFGSLMLIISRYGLKAAGFVSAGLGLVFLGIDFMQLAMADAAETFRPEHLPSTDFAGRILLAGIGTLMTVLMQSSGAAMAITLTALAAGGIDYSQGAALAVGQNIGTTITAALAALGGTLSAKRTATAHILFNLSTAFFVLIIFPVFLSVIVSFNGWLQLNEPMMQLAVFHTAFNVFGVALFTPFISKYAKLIKKLIARKQEKITAALEKKLLDMPDAAITAAGVTALNITALIFAKLSDYLSGKVSPDPAMIAELREANTSLAKYTGSVRVEDSERQNQVANLVHCIDHFESFFTILNETEKVAYLLQSEEMKKLTSGTSDIIHSVLNYANHKGEIDLQQLAYHSKDMAEHRKAIRKHIIETTTRSGRDAEHVMLGIESVRWLDRVAFHSWRLCQHLEPVTRMHSSEKDGEE